MIFPDNQLNKFCVYIGWCWIFTPPPEISIKHRGSFTT